MESIFHSFSTYLVPLLIKLSLGLVEYILQPDKHYITLESKMAVSFTMLLSFNIISVTACMFSQYSNFTLLQNTIL